MCAANSAGSSNCKTLTALHGLSPVHADEHKWPSLLIPGSPPLSLQDSAAACKDPACTTDEIEMMHTEALASLQVGDEDRETCAGLQAAVFAPWVERIAAEAAAASEAGTPAWDPPSVSLLDMELEPVLLSKAAQLGLPAQWVARLARLDNQRRQVSIPYQGLVAKVPLFGSFVVILAASAFTMAIGGGIEGAGSTQLLPRKEPQITGFQKPVREGPPGMCRCCVSAAAWQGQTPGAFSRMGISS